jgi:hypothetical protein
MYKVCSKITGQNPLKNSIFRIFSHYNNRDLSKKLPSLKKGLGDNLVFDYPDVLDPRLDDIPDLEQTQLMGRAYA